MGRTIPSYRIVLETEIAKWKRFLDALPSKAEKEAFVELMNHCRRHIQRSIASRQDGVQRSINGQREL